MKRKGMLLLLTLLCTLSMAVLVAPALADESACNHYAMCTQPEICALCGEPYTGVAVQHDFYKWDANAEGCILVCRNCNTVEPHSSRIEHSASCNRLGICIRCGYEDADMKTVHLDTFTASDENGHWEVCADCTVTSGFEKHYVWCNDSSKCQYCNESNMAEVEYMHRGYDYENLKYDATHHWAVCESCQGNVDGGKVSVNAHDFTCNADTCSKCDAPKTATSTVRHNFDYSTYKYDATSHWRECRDCGDKTSVHAHENYCTNPTKCAHCGADYSSTDITHINGNRTWAYDATSHWYECEGCNEKLSKFSHTSDCTQPQICEICNVEYDGSQVWHSGYEDRYDEVSHWAFCTSCNKMIGIREEHRANCTDPTVCASCGMTGTFDVRKFNHSSTTRYYDDDSHWSECNNCDWVGFAGKHMVYCLNPGVCVAGCIVSHDYDPLHEWDWYDESLVPLLYEHDATGHWAFCQTCQSTELEGAHEASCLAPTTCLICGGVYEGMSVTHDFNYQIYQSNATQHWNQCKNCEAKENAVDHVVICGQTKCVYCGTEVANVQDGYVRHAYDTSAFAGNGSAHWHACIQCGGKIDEAEHTPSDADPAVCGVCGLSISTVTVGDLTGDGILDGRDVLRLMKMLANASSVSDEAADLNGDGVGDGRDVLRLMRNVGQ